MSKSLGYFGLLVGIGGVTTGVVHGELSSTPVGRGTYLLINMYFFHEYKALFFGKTSTSSTKSYKRKDLIVPQNWSNLSIVQIIRIAAEQKGLNYVFLEVSIKLFIRDFFSKFNDHLPPYQFEDLVNPKASLRPFHPLDGNDLVHAVPVLHHLDIGGDGKTGEHGWYYP